MADRFPLIANSSANQVQEIASGDNLDLTGNNIIGVSNIDSSRINVTGVSTLSGQTYIPNVAGITTFSSGLTASGATELENLRVSGVTTVGANLVISASGNDTHITDSDGSIVVNSSQFLVKDSSGSNTLLSLTEGGANDLYYNNSKKLETTNAGVTVTGGVVANSFTGDGSAITNIISQGTGVLVRDDGVNVGTAATINFGGNLYVTTISSGIVTVTSGGVDSGYFSGTDVGIHTLSSVGIGTTNPTEPLHVFGNILSTSTISAQNFNTTSDARLKENIVTVENALDIVTSIRGVTFDWIGGGESSVGVIAQEVEAVLPEIIANGGSKQVNYNGLIGVLIEAVKELKTENEVLKAQVQDIINTINT
jgi:hypothetical protein